MTEQPDATDDLTAIRARVWEVCARTGVADDQLAEVIGVDPGRIAAGFACERRFSTYELAAIAEHGRTSVEWLCGDSDEYESAAQLAAIVARYQPILDALPEQETTPGAAEWLVAEMNEWAPLRAEANRALLSGEPEAVQIRIDLNARTHDGRYVPARRDQASGPVKRCDNVIVYEPDDGVATTATVMRCDDTWLHLDVDWDYMVDTSASHDENSDHSYRDKVNAPLRPETIAALNARLAAGNMPTVTVPRRERQERESDAR